MQALAGQPGQGGATIGNMSEPDAVPLPRDGEVFFDVRGEARSMRLSWYADSNVAVFSIWQGNRCTGTFRLPFVDLARMVQTLQSGPPAPAPAPPSQPAHGYSATVAAYDSGPGAGVPYGQDRRYDYDAATARQDFGAAAGHQAEHGYPTGQDFGAGHYRADRVHADGQAYGAGQDYGAGQGYGASHDYGAGQGQSTSRDYGADHNQAAGQDYGTGSGFGTGPAYGTDRSYGGDTYHPSDPYGTSEPYHGSEPYRPGEPYLAAGQYRATEQYRAPEQYRATEQNRAPEENRAPEQYRPVEQHSQNEPYRTLGYGADQPGHGLPGYAPPNYGDLPPAVPVLPNRGADSESVPDTAMMSFPSVPARNGPSGYR